MKRIFFGLLIALATTVAHAQLMFDIKTILDDDGYKISWNNNCVDGVKPGTSGELTPAYSADTKEWSQSLIFENCQATSPAPGRNFYFTISKSGIDVCSVTFWCAGTTGDCTGGNVHLNALTVIGDAKCIYSNDGEKASLCYTASGQGCS